MTVAFPDIDWGFLQQVYGWAALQWQAWARGEIVVNEGCSLTLDLYATSVLEFWIDGVHYFGGDMYEYRRAPVTLHLEPGRHRLDIRLARDVRAHGGLGEPKLNFSLTLEKALSDVQALGTEGALIADFVGDSPEEAFLVRPFGSVTVHNHLKQSIIVHSVESSSGTVGLLSDEPITLKPSQSRPLIFQVDGVRGFQEKLPFNFTYTVAGQEKRCVQTFFAKPRFRQLHAPHKITYLHASGIVSYAIIRPPSLKAIKSVNDTASLPILLVLHGAGVEADSDVLRTVLDPVPDIAAWVLIPSGVTPWSGDDWHNFGFADVEAATAAVLEWIESASWTGPGVDVDRWLVMGHSNGGQGTWYVLTHHPDRVIAVAALSGYTSIQNYVPYTFWHPADSGRTAVVQAVLNNYRHELLLPNAQGIEVLRQHGELDDNVPAYHSRLMGQLAQEIGIDSPYFEIPGHPHYWDGVMTTEPLKEFYERHINRGEDGVPFKHTKFRVVTVNPGDTGSKFGLEISQVQTPGQLASIDVTFEPLEKSCYIEIFNVRQFFMPVSFPLGFPPQVV